MGYAVYVAQAETTDPVWLPVWLQLPAEDSAASDVLALLRGRVDDPDARAFVEYLESFVQRIARTARGIWCDLVAYLTFLFS